MASQVEVVRMRPREARAGFGVAGEVVGVSNLGCVGSEVDEPALERRPNFLGQLK